MGNFPQPAEASVCTCEHGSGSTPECRDGSRSWQLGFITEIDWGYVNFGIRKEKKLDWDLRKGVFTTIQMGFIKACVGTRPRVADWVFVQIGEVSHTEEQSGRD